MKVNRLLESCALALIVSMFFVVPAALADDDCVSGPECADGYVCDPHTGNCVLACPGTCTKPACNGTTPPCPTSSDVCSQLSVTGCEACGCSDWNGSTCTCR